MRPTLAVAAWPLVFQVGTFAQQWQAVVLHPDWARASAVNGVTPTQQVGTCNYASNGIAQAGLWQGSPGSWVPLADQSVFSYGNGMDLAHQWGTVADHASLWSGTAESRIDLNPPQGPVPVLSTLTGVYEDMQVGGVTYIPSSGFVTHAAMWRGTPESFIDLNPAGAAQSGCAATDGVLQGGTVRWNSGFHAAVWRGSPESMVDLNPPGAVSFVRGMARGVQVGEASLPAPAGLHAVLWRGTPDSFVDMSPSIQAQSSFWATSGRVHVGWLGQQGLGRAAICFGSQQAWIGLHQFLPTRYNTFSQANAVYQDGPTVYVGGWAQNPDSGYDEAVLWIGTDPCYANCDTSTQPPVLNVNDFICFLGKFAAGDPYANCDGSTAPPVLNVNDFVCFLTRFAGGCS